MPKTPGYRQRKDDAQAIVTLTDVVTERRRDYWLGEYGTPESRERCHRLVAEWESNGGRLSASAFNDLLTETSVGGTIEGRDAGVLAACEGPGRRA